MSLGQRLGRLQDELDGVQDRQTLEAAQLFGDVVAFQVLHHHVRQARIERPDVEHSGDVLAPDLRGGPRFAAEALGSVGPLGCRLAPKTYGDALLEVAAEGRDDNAHTAKPQDLLDAVLAGEHVAFLNRGIHELTAKATPSSPETLTPSGGRPDVGSETSSPRIADKRSTGRNPSPG